MIENDIILKNSIHIPHIGLGTYPMFGDILKNTIENAYEVGYRLIDTADNYYNEEDLGMSLQNLYNKTNAKRENLILISKVSDELYHPNELGGGTNKGLYFWNSSKIMQQNNAVKKILNKKINDTLRFLKTDYLDIYLMHWPYPDFFLEIWYEMEQIYKEGKARVIGVCNCRERHLERLKKNCEILPMINQFESSPLNTKSSLIEYCTIHDIKVMVYSPLMTLRYAGYKQYHEYLLKLARKYNKEKAQIILRFDIQRGLIPIPKSTNSQRLKANFSIFDFSLSAEEMNVLLKFNENKASLPESRSCPGL